MKTVIVGGSKILAGIVLVLLLGVLAVLLWLQYGISPFNRLTAQTIAIGKTDPDRAMTMIPKLYEMAEKDKVSLEDRSKMYIELGQFYGEHSLPEEAIGVLTKSIECSHASWRGPFEGNARLARAIYQLQVCAKHPITADDLKQLQMATETYPALADADHKDFWPMYYKTLAWMQFQLKQGDLGAANFQKALELAGPAGLGEFELTELEGDYLQWLIEQGKYVEANKKFIAYYKALPPSTMQYHLQARYFTALSAVCRLRDVNFTERVVDLLNDKKFSELDREIADLQKDKAMYPSGQWVRSDFYAALENLDNNAPESVWKKRIDLMKEWIAAKPASDAAKVSLGRLLIDYAWRARGNGWSGEVTEDGWKVFAARLAQARETLEGVKDRQPEWYTSMQTCALGQSWDAAEYNAMVDEGMKKFPTYDYIKIHKAYWLLPRWNGAEGELEKFVTEQSDKRGGTAGDILYSRFAWYFDNHAPTQVFTSTGLKWPRVKSGLQQLVKENPDSYYARGMLSTLAMEAGEDAVAFSAISDDALKSTDKGKSTNKGKSTEKPKSAHK